MQNSCCKKLAFVCVWMNAALLGFSLSVLWCYCAGPVGVL